MSRSARSATSSEAISPQLLRAYRLTRYRAGGCEIRIGRQAPDALFAAIRSRNGTLLTAWNPSRGACRMAGTNGCSGGSGSGCGGVSCWRRKDRCMAGGKRCCWWVGLWRAHRARATVPAERGGDTATGRAGAPRAAVVGYISTYHIACGPGVGSICHHGQVSREIARSDLAPAAFTSPCAVTLSGSDWRSRR